MAAPIITTGSPLLACCRKEPGAPLVTLEGTAPPSHRTRGHTHARDVGTQNTKRVSCEKPRPQVTRAALVCVNFYNSDKRTNASTSLRLKDGTAQNVSSPAARQNDPKSIFKP